MRWFLTFTVVLAAAEAGPFAFAEDTSQKDAFIVHQNTVGYRPESRKIGTVAAKTEQFVVRNAQSGTQVIEGARDESGVELHKPAALYHRFLCRQARRNLSH